MANPEPLSLISGEPEPLAAEGPPLSPQCWGLHAKAVSEYFTRSESFAEVLTAAKARNSRDSEGRALDTIRVEYLWRWGDNQAIDPRERRRITDLIAALKA